MIIAGTRPPDPAEVARQLRERMGRADEVGHPRSGDDPTGADLKNVGRSTEDPPVEGDAAAN